MKLALISAAAIAVMGVAVPAQAGEGQAYGTIGAGLISVEDLNLTAVQARVGFNFTENIAIEGEGSIGVSGDSNVDLESSFAGFAVGKIPVGDQFDIFARVGYHTSDYGDNFGGGNVDGIAFGGGGEFSLDDNNGFRAEYTNYDADFGSADVFSLSYVRKFGG